MMKKNIIGIIPARGGSKGIPRKNIVQVRGKPLIAYSIEQAENAKLLKEFYVSTEDEEIANVSQEYGAKVLPRPHNLAGDAIATVDVLKQCILEVEKQGKEVDAILLLQPTSPFRRKEDIDNAIREFISQNADALVSVCEVPGHYSPYWQFKIEKSELKPFSGEEVPKRRQDLPKTYTRNGAIYIASRETLMNGSMFGKKTVAFVMPSEFFVNIDEPKDLENAERVLGELE